MNSAVRERMQALVVLLAVALLTVSCVIDTPVIESAEGDGVSIGTSGTDDAPTPIAQVEPTALPSPPTPQPTVAEAPTPVPTLVPTPEPAPTSAPRPDAPPPLPTVTEEAEFQPTVVPAGLIAIPVLDTTFRLDDPRPILQLGGHTLIYIDDQARSEVDIFTPVAFDDGTEITSYDEVIAFLLSDPLLDLGEAPSVTIAGHATRVFEGVGLEQSRAFITDLTQLKNPDFGWVPPVQLKLWVVDHPRGTVVVTAEALEASDQYGEALELAADILSTVDFG